MTRIIIKTGIIFSILLFLFLLYYNFGGNQDREIIVLPTYGPMKPSSIGDSKTHQVSDFSFTNQFEETVDQKNMDGCIYIADFFFTTCQSICPIMSS
jgi:cytochrome oxidase Cu insertion factor (SCO1/SenC/PrrC family)